MKKHEGSIRNYLNINNIITIFSNEIHRLKREGLKPTKICRHLVLDYRTVKKYLAMNEEQYFNLSTINLTGKSCWTHMKNL